MTSMNFHDQQKQTQINWRKAHISFQAFGYQNGNQYEHIIPPSLWHETLWQWIRKELPAYLSSKSIQSHTGTHNLLSSWVVCANLYFIIKINPNFKQLMLGFLRKHVSPAITGITDVELEFALDGALNPSNLLGEQGGKRGAGQTSPDVAFIVETENGSGLVLTECKYTEHSFYPCSARRKTHRDKPANPDPSRCMNDAKSYSYKSICQQTVWGRKYWDNLTLSEHGKNVLRNCPASSSGYQLFRQQSLAEGFASKGNYGLVASSVAFDDRNQPLKGCLSSTGIDDFTTGWGKLFAGKALFKTWTHQQWVEYVRQNGIGFLEKDWVNYLNVRYGY